MKLSEDVRALYAEFFEQAGVCPRGSFPEVVIYGRRGASFITSIAAVEGITFGRRVFLNSRHIKREGPKGPSTSGSLMAHELVHVIQYSRDGFLRFLWKYLLDFAGNFWAMENWNRKTWYEAYCAVPHEIEAKQLASRFVEWLAERENGPNP